MKTRDEVITLFRDKYDSLKSVYPEVGSFDEAASTNFYQNPDGGWQLNLAPCAAITLRPGDDKAHEIHGAVCARWYEEGGAFEGDIPGWLGYPVQDQEESLCDVAPPCPTFWYDSQWNPKPISVKGATAAFDFGKISWCSGLPWERANEHHAYDGMKAAILHQQIENMEPGPDGKPICGDDIFDELLKKLDEAIEEEKAGVAPNIKELLCNHVLDDYFLLLPESYAELNETGKQHIPLDIDATVKYLFTFRNLHLTGGMTHACEPQKGKGVVWKFNVPAEEYSSMIVTIWRDGTNVRGTIDTMSKPKKSFLSNVLGESEDAKHEEFAIPNYFKVVRR